MMVGRWNVLLRRPMFRGERLVSGSVSLNCWTKKNPRLPQGTCHLLSSQSHFFPPCGAEVWSNAEEKSQGFNKFCRYKRKRKKFFCSCVFHVRKYHKAAAKFALLFFEKKWTSYTISTIVCFSVSTCCCFCVAEATSRGANGSFQVLLAKIMVDFIITQPRGLDFNSLQKPVLSYLKKTKENPFLFSPGSQKGLWRFILFRVQFLHKKKKEVHKNRGASALVHLFEVPMMTHKATVHLILQVYDAFLPDFKGRFIGWG